MEDDQLKLNKFSLYLAKLRTSFFNIMFELLKEKNTGTYILNSLINFF